MCFAQNNAAAEAQAQAKAIQDREDKRQADIKTGQGSIDSAFSQFNDGYYNQFKDTYKSAYDPQISDQYSQARDKLTATLAGRGMLESQTGADAFGGLQRTKSSAEGQVANNANDAANSLRGSVENTKTNLYSLNASAADPASIASQAQAQATAVVAPQAYPQLGQVFAGALQPFATANQADRTGMNPQLPWNRIGTAPLGNTFRFT